LLGISFIGACWRRRGAHPGNGALLGKLPDDSGPWKKGREKPMSACEYYDHDNLKAGGRT